MLEKWKGRRETPRAATFGEGSGKGGGSNRKIKREETAKVMKSLTTSMRIHDSNRRVWELVDRIEYLPGGSRDLKSQGNRGTTKFERCDHQTGCWCKSQPRKPRNN